MKVTKKVGAKHSLAVIAKIAGIIALVAIIGFGFASCEDDNCSTCGGTGIVTCSVCDGTGTYILKCFGCDGKGEIKCIDCDGSGKK